MAERSYPIAGSLCPECGGPVGTVGAGADVHCLAGCGYQRSAGDEEARQEEKTAYVDGQTCWGCE